jgi:hypothetical protein
VENRNASIGLFVVGGLLLFGIGMFVIGDRHQAFARHTEYYSEFVNLAGLNLNAFAERWVRSAKEECLSKLILFGEGPLSRTLAEFSAHYHGERNDQGKGNKLLFPDASNKTEQRSHAVECRQRLGGLLKFYARAA